MRVRISRRRHWSCAANIVAKFALMLIVMLFFAVGSLCPAQAQQGSHAKLVVLLVADQFSYNYLARYFDKFSSNGFRLLLERGANFTNCRYQQSNTQSASGHSVIATGAYPWATGIVADEWYNRRKGKTISAVSDDNVQMVGGGSTAGSAHYMQGTTIGDQLKLATNSRSKVFSISLKDSSAVLLAGRLATNAFFFDPRTGNFVGGSQYGKELPGWVQAFNDRHYANQYANTPWQRLLPETQYSASVQDDYSYERVIPGDGRQFPHALNSSIPDKSESFYRNFAMTPFANQMLCDLAREAIDRENLGQHADTDLLAVSFSAGESLGQSFGPYSQEVEDLSLRLDLSLSSLLQHLNQKVGL